MFKRLIQHYWQMTLMRISPADTLYSLPLLVMMGLLYTVIVIAQWMMVDLQPPFTLDMASLAALSLAMSYAVYTWALLAFKQRDARLVQTLTCLWASHLIIHSLAFPMLLTAPSLLESQASAMNLFLGLIYLFITLMLSIWQFMVTIFIYRAALTCNMVYGVVAAVGLLAVNILIVSIWR